tara:strand:+ start:887 stop:1030 length:144 start_codon:yes stop_codon:yes gene_type:complete
VTGHGIKKNVSEKEKIQNILPAEDIKEYKQKMVIRFVYIKEQIILIS